MKFFFLLLITFSLSALFGQNYLEDLSYNQVQMKAAHNSYQRKENIPNQLAWDTKNPWQGGCRALEYDIVQSKNSWNFSVQHESSYSSQPDKQLSHWLEKLKRWSQEYPQHDVITLFIDLKNAHLQHDDFCQEMDQILKTHLGSERLFKPAELMRDAPDLVQGAQKYGWPCLRQLRGKIIVCFTGSGEDSTGRRKAFYAGYQPKERLAFVDIDCSIGYNLPSLSSGNRVFVNLHISILFDEWKQIGRIFSQEQGFLTRGWLVNDKLLWNSALNDGSLNFIATDKIRRHSWARVGVQPFRQIEE